MGTTEANFLQHMLATAILKCSICIDRNHSQFFKCVLEDQPLCLSAVTFSFGNIVLQMDPHAALTLLEVNVLQFTFTNNLISNHDGKEHPVCSGIGIKITVCNFRGVHIFILVADSWIILKILIELVAHLPRHRLE